MKHRNNVIEEIRSDKKFDVIVIGGGASGIGAAVEAQLRGYSTLLLEKYDFTKGTSSKSTKLIHGGVRYMVQGDLKMVREALRERGYLVRNAPYLVHDQPFIIPNYRWWEGAFYTLGLKFYDLLAGRYSLGRSVHMSKRKVLEKLPGVSAKGLRGGVLYHDGQFDDSRLAVDLLHLYFNEGGLALNYAEVMGLEKNEERISGVVFTDRVDQKNYSVQADIVLNATGVWADEVMKMDRPGHRHMIRPSQGIHLVLDKSFMPGDHALMIPKTSDGRVLFAVPWHDRLVVGTTDTPVNTADPEPEALEQEIAFILETASAYLERKVEPSDVLSVFAGLRPLAAPKDENSKTKEISRNHKIVVSPGKLITVIGGKWTTYRKMGEDMIDRAIAEGLLSPAASKSRTTMLPGPKEQHVPFSIYGENAEEIAEITVERPETAEKIHPGLPYTWAEVEWICANEMVMHLEDLLARRLRALLLNASAASEAAEAVAGKIGPLLGWSSERTQTEVRDFRRLAGRYMLR